MENSQFDVMFSALTFAAKLSDELGGRPTAALTGFDLCSSAPEDGLAAKVDVVLPARRDVDALALAGVIRRAGGRITDTDPPRGIMPFTYFVTYPGGEAAVDVEGGRIQLSTGGQCIRVTDKQANTW